MKTLIIGLLIGVACLGLSIWVLKNRERPTAEKIVEKIIHEKVPVPTQNPFKLIIKEGQVINFDVEPLNKKPK